MIARVRQKGLVIAHIRLQGPLITCITRHEPVFARIRPQGPLITRISAFGALLMVSGTGSAHSGTGLAGGFVPGFQHPFTGLDHLLAMVAVGLWGAFLGPPLI